MGLNTACSTMDYLRMNTRTSLPVKKRPSEKYNGKQNIYWNWSNKISVVIAGLLKP